MQSSSEEVEFYTAHSHPKSVEDGTPRSVERRLGDSYHLYFQNYAGKSVPRYVRLYVKDTLGRRFRQTRISFDQKKIAYDVMLRRIARDNDCCLDKWRLNAIFDKIKEFITPSILDRVADRFVDLGIPLQETRERFTAEHEAYKRILNGLDLTPYSPSDVEAIKTEIRTSLYDVIPARSPMHGFIASFFNDVFVESSLKKSMRDRFCSDQKFVRDFLFKRANAYAWNYKHDRKPSQYAISYCRANMDKHWKNRQYGQSVTTLFLERFEKEIAHASTARYTNEVSNFKKGTPNGDAHFQGGIDGIRKVYQYDDQGKTPYKRSGIMFERLRETLFESFDENERDFDNRWKVEVARENDFQTYEQLAINAQVIVRETFFDKKTPLQCAMIGIMANMFVEQASMNPDFVFIACLEAFILSETKRHNMMELHPNSHKAFKLSAERIKANRKRDNLKQYSAFEGDEYVGFCWYQFILRHLHCTENLLTNQWKKESDQVIFVRSEAIRSRVRRFLRMPKKKYAQMHEHKLGCLAPTLTKMLNVLVANEVTRNDADAILDYEMGRIGGRFSSATLRAFRFTVTNTGAPMFARRAACVPLKDKGLILRIGDKQDWMDMIGSTLSADAATRIIRKVRSDIMCGYSLIGCGMTDAVGQQERAMLAARRALQTEVKNLSILDKSGMYFESFKAQYQPIEPYVDTPIAARSMLTAAMRYTALRGDEYAIQQVERISYEQMMRMIDPACKTSRYPDKATARNSSVFAAWKNMAIEYGANSQNHLLSYLMFASRYAVVSRIASISALAPTATPPQEEARLIAFPLLSDKLTSDVIYSYRFMNGERMPVKGVSRQSLFLSLPDEYGFITKEQEAKRQRPIGHHVCLTSQFFLPEELEGLTDKGYKQGNGPFAGVYSDLPSIEYSRLVVTDRRVDLDGSVPAPYRTDVSNAVCLQFSASTGRYAIVPTEIALGSECHGLRGEARAQYMENHALISGVIETNLPPEKMPCMLEQLVYNYSPYCYGDYYEEVGNV